MVGKVASLLVRGRFPKWDVVTDCQTIISYDEVVHSSRATGVGTGDSCAGIGAHRDAAGNSWPRGIGSKAGRAHAYGGRKGGFRIGITNRGGEAVLQPEYCGRQNHVATSASGYTSTPRMAGEGGTEPGAAAGGDSGCGGRKRACRRIEYQSSRAGCGRDCAD